MAYNKIAIILDQYPSATETFISAELEMLSRHYSTAIFALSRDSRLKSRSEEDVTYLSPSFMKICLRHTQCFLKYPIMYLSVITSGLAGKQPKNAIKAFYQAVYFIPIIRRNKVRHIHCHFANKPVDIALALNKILGIPFSFSAHANDIYVNNRTLVSKIEKSAFVVTCTKYNQKHLCGLVSEENQDKIYLNYHGVSVSKWNFKPSNGEFKLLSVGRLVEKKGHYLTLEALAILNRAGHRFKYTIIGDGPMIEYLKKKAKDLDIQHLVNFAGSKPHDQMPVIYNTHSALLHISVVTDNGDRDGIPNVLFEAMASGTAIITTSVSGIPEAVNDDSALVISENTPHMIADAILALATDDALRQMLVVNARRRVEEFDSQIHHGRLRDILDPYFNK